MSRLPLVAFSSVVLALLHGCIASHTGTPSLEVEASIASVTLAQDCGASEPTAPSLRAGDCAEEGPCGFCQQTAVQLAIEAGAGDASVPFEVLAVRLHTMDGRLLQELAPRGARVFSGDQYVAWDEQIAPGASLQVSYDTSAPDWAAIGGGDAWSTYGMSFRIVMVVRIDGVERTLQFAPASREPEIVT